ncbi:hypothetical protein [Methanogenium cariaci]|uniref:hypothetical protein n=1 Tax=Methanogenium cariaci TaxID=2197 RepID=UPI0007816DB3|nr:hypothetical protein [Methanogenium cariaci]
METPPYTTTQLITAAGGVSVSDGTLTIGGDTTIHDNTADYGGGVYAYDSRLTLRNNLFSNEKNFDAYTRSSYVWDAVFNQTLLLKDNIAGGPYCGGEMSGPVRQAPAFQRLPGMPISMASVMKISRLLK